MNVDYSKDFKKSVKKLSGKMLDSVRRVVEEVKNAESLKDITDSKKLVGYRNVYRIRIGDYRAFFTFHIEIINDTIIFRYLVPRGEAYDKKAQKVYALILNEDFLPVCNSSTSSCKARSISDNIIINLAKPSLSPASAYTINLNAVMSPFLGLSLCGFY